MSEEHRSFATLLTALEGGRIHKELTDFIQDAVAELHNTRQNQGGKPKAKIVLSVELKLDSDVIEVTADVKGTLPKQIREKTVLFATPDNHLTHRNPKQRDMFKDVTGPVGQAAEPRTA